MIRFFARGDLTQPLSRSVEMGCKPLEPSGDTDEEDECGKIFGPSEYPLSTV